MTPRPPDIISWNLTERCNLECDHCYLSAHARAGAGDLSTDDCLSIVAQLEQTNPHQLLILTGGEPLLRPDLTTISRAAADTGMTVVVGTNGTLLDGEAVARLRDAGVSGIGISIDSATDPTLHDRLRGRPGAWSAAMRGIELCQAAGMEFLVQTSVFAWNRAELPAIADLAAKLGARAWNVYFLVCTGRGQELTDIPSDVYEQTLQEVRTIQRRVAGQMLVAVRCAPQYRRVVAQDPDPSFAFHSYSAGCPAAINYARIDPRGQVTPCPYMPTVAGTLGADQSFQEIWQQAEVMTQLRDRSALQGRCQPCSYRETCGGCRARALAVHGDLLAEDPSCTWEQAAGDTPDAPPATFGLVAARTMRWQADAIARLDRVPSFLHGLVVRGVEREAKERAAPEVTPEIMQAVRARMQENRGAPTGPPPPATPLPTAAQRPKSATITWAPDALNLLATLPAIARRELMERARVRATQLGTDVIDAALLGAVHPADTPDPTPTTAR